MSAASETYDVAVIGLGAMGSAALYQLAARGARVIGVDRFVPPHAFGSSHGETRITRQAIGEGEAYVPLALRSHALWREIEAATGERLLRESGCLIISDPEDEAERPGRTGFLRRTFAAAKQFAIAHERLDAQAIRRRFPQFLVRDGDEAYFEPGGGYVLPERCIAAQLRLAQAHSARFRPGLTVLSIEQGAGAVRIETTEGAILAATAIVAAGAWAPRLLGAPFDRLLKPARQTLHWFAVDDAFADAWRRGPTFIWAHGADADDFFYGFPALSGAVKTASEYYGGPVDPDRYDREAAPRESARMFETHLRGRLAGVSDRRLRAATCLYTATADSAFLIDRHPRADRILVVSPCSGHGFKHSAAIGEAAAQIALDGASAIDLSAFALARLLRDDVAPAR